MDATRTIRISDAATAAVAALAALPIDTLPPLCSVTVRTDSGGPAHVTAQLASAGDDDSPAAWLRLLVAWRDALPDDVYIDARPLASARGQWQVSVQGRLAWVPFEVWTIVTSLPEDVEQLARATDSPALAGLVLVQRLLDDAGGA